MCYMLDVVHPEVFYGLSAKSTDAEVKDALKKYTKDIATTSEKRKLAYCIFGNTGSSWNAQMDMLCALNHLPIIDRVNIAESIYNLYEMEGACNKLRGMDHVKPDMGELPAHD